MTTNRNFELNTGAESSNSLFSKSLVKYLIWIGIMAVLVVIINVI